ncbi:hypothetical protein L6452_28805 [Arctium lappa]|uniref:Uncharacterized protein n=1 Tax=Arctium lappa TaxID=4217 RepID=A0ACB8ZZY3_ARCLA|nr:hypothetical protein L6452_28805 [Arctium lappa]
MGVGGKNTHNRSLLYHKIRFYSQLSRSRFSLLTAARFGESTRHGFAAWPRCICNSKKKRDMDMTRGLKLSGLMKLSFQE